MFHLTSRLDRAFCPKGAFCYSVVLELSLSVSVKESEQHRYGLSVQDSGARFSIMVFGKFELGILNPGPP